ncbi:MAG: hypothetical protein HY866_23610 [Chloroflexi bacterium]|nr:hypothetical protein [Chloroflexota bacterium]
MKRRLVLALFFVLPLLLSACANKTMLRFSNETDCGTASISLTNMKTGHIRDYKVDQNKEIEIEVDPNIEYHYEVTYPRQPNYVVCDAKKVTTMLTKGKAVNISLESVVDPALEQSLTQTPVAP